MSTYQRIFAALDGTDAQNAVIRRAVALARANGAALYFAHVVDSLPADANGADYQALAAGVREAMEENLAPMLEELANDPRVPSCEFKVGVGRVVDVLEEHVGEWEPDLVVGGERGYSDIKYAFVGSVSKHLIRTCRCDVLVVKE